MQQVCGILIDANAHAVMRYVVESGRGSEKVRSMWAVAENPGLWEEKGQMQAKGFFSDNLFSLSTPIQYEFSKLPEGSEKNAEEGVTYYYVLSTLHRRDIIHLSASQQALSDDCGRSSSSDP